MLSLVYRALRPSLSVLVTSATLAIATASTLATPNILSAQTAASTAASPLRATPDRLTQPIQESNRVTLQGTLHPLANKANDRGGVSDGMKLSRIQVVLKRSDAQESALKQLVGEMHAPGSANYHKWLTPESFGKQFGPSDADVAKLETWLSSHGFSITKLNAGRQTLEIAGTAGQFREAFHTQIHSYQVKGETHFANSSAPEIPAALAPVFGGFASLNNFRLKSHANVLGKAQFNAATHESKPEWTIGTATDYSLALAPGDFNVQYDLNPLYNAGTKGDGQSIAIVNESNINIAQVNNYRTLFGLPANPPQVIIDGNDPGIDGINSPYGANYASGEAYLDVELSGAVAPNAQINLVIANDTELENGLTLALERAVYSNISPIISLSFGGCEADQGSFNTFINGLWEQAAAQGITVLVSTGDSGSAGCDNDNTQYYAVAGQAVNGLGSTPYNVAVGGTDFYYSGGASGVPTYWNTTPSNSTPTVSLLSKAPEQPWNDSQYGLNLIDYYSSYGVTSIAAGSGGASTAGLGTGTTASPFAPYPKPSWQVGTGVPSDGARDLPDVSLFAANGLNATYYPVCISDGDCEGGSVVQISGIGGTSASTPAFAGIMALVNQKYGRQGQANYVLYPLAQQFPSAFNDVVTGTNSVPCALTSTNVAAKNCQSVANPITVDDPTYGTAVEGEIGLTAGVPAYNAAVGYDLATGLGTIDANNLVTNWGSVKLGATTTTLTPSATSFAHGTSVTISGAVTGASPTGNVALVTTSTATSNQGEDVFPLTSGAYTGSVNYLPGGTYDISGYFAGDGSNAASSSTPVSITVTPEASKTTLAIYSSLSSSTGTPLPASGGALSYGAPATFSAAAASLTTTTTNPTGTVVFSNGANALNTAVINSEGDAEFNSALAPGSYSVTANYSGDSSYNASASAATSFTVAKNTPTMSFYFPYQFTDGTGLSGQTNYLAISVENSASVNGLALAPTGVVTLAGAPAGTPTSATLVPAVDPTTGSPNGVAYFAVPATASGTSTLSFSYQGDTNYASAALTSPLTLNNATGDGFLSSSISATATATQTSPTAQVVVTATITGQTGNAAPTGTLVLFTTSATFDATGNTYVLAQTTLPSATGDSVTVTYNVNSASIFQGTNQIILQYIPDNNSAYNPSATEITIANPLSDFSLIPATTTVSVPNTGATPGVQTDAINLTSYNGFSGPVNLACTATAGITCSLNSAAATLAADGSASAVVTVNTSAVTAAGTYSVVITGTDSTGHYIHTIGLQVVTPLITQTATPSFTLAGGAVAIAAPGGAGTSTISATPTNAFTGSIALTCAITASPAGAAGTPTCSLNPASVTIAGTTAATSVLTVDTTAATTAGTYTVTVTGVSGTITQTTGINVVVTGVVTPAGTFTLTNNAPITIATQGATSTSTVSVVPDATTPYAGAVGLTCAITASPAGATELPTCSLTPASVTLAGAPVTSTLTISTTAQTTTKLDMPLKGIFTAGGGVALATLLFFGIPVGRRGKRTLRILGTLRILSMALLFAMIAGAALGCGGGTSNGGGGGATGGTTTGTYTVTVTGTPTSGTAPTVAVTVTVN